MLAPVLPSHTMLQGGASPTLKYRVAVVRLCAHDRFADAATLAAPCQPRLHAQTGGTCVRTEAAAVPTVEPWLVRPGASDRAHCRGTSPSSLACCTLLTVPPSNRPMRPVANRSNNGNATAAATRARWGIPA